MDQTVASSQTAVRRVPLADVAYEEIKRAIVYCDLEPGTSISESMLADRFDLSRAAVRPALKMLYQDRLVQFGSTQRYVVPPITIRETTELFDLRALVEPQGASLAATRITESDIDRLHTLSEAHYTPGDAPSTRSFIESNTEFHTIVAEASGNVVLADVLAKILERVERLIHFSHLLGDRNESATIEHHDLVQCLRQRDATAAANVMREGIEDSKHFVLRALLSSPSIQSTCVSLP